MQKSLVPESKQAYGKTMIVLADGLPLFTGGLTAVAVLARGGRRWGWTRVAVSVVGFIWGGGFGGGRSHRPATLALAISAVLAGLSATAAFCRPAWVTASMDYGCSYRLPLLQSLQAAICLRTDVRPASAARHYDCAT